MTEAVVIDPIARFLRSYREDLPDGLELQRQMMAVVRFRYLVHRERLFHAMGICSRGPR